MGQGQSFQRYFNDYFAKDNPVCREERQYALFLYQRLLNMVGNKTPKEEKIFRACGLPTDSDLEILSVAYEATYMRDIFWKDREQRKKNNQKAYKVPISDKESGECFNRKLYEFVKKEYNCEDCASKVPANRNLGGKIKWENVNEKVASCFRQMMNSKPDIAIVYEYKSERYLKFLECKYLSGVSNSEGVTQLEIQRRICRFLCEDILNIKAAEVKCVQFREKRDESEPDALELKELIPDNLVPKENIV